MSKSKLVMQSDIRDDFDIPKTYSPGSAPHPFISPERDCDAVIGICHTYQKGGKDVVTIFTPLKKRSA